ncbi:MAG TPA: hypothetical protein VHK01_06325 [Lacipirellulaceae bacterium]|nr:hypothetical protein [Lacipirellulaceae bacterium]
MNTSAPQIFDRMGWEGLVDGRTALFIGVVVALAAAWSLWRERRAVGRGWAAAFWVLRVVAFGVALWMLAGPTQQRVERTTTTQSIAIFADGSESMGVVDPPEPADAVRWALAVSGKSNDDALVRCDKLGVALGAALSECHRFAQMVKEHRPTKQLTPLLTTITASTQRASEHISALVSGLDGSDASMIERATRIATLIEGPVSELLAAIRQGLDRSGGAVGEDFSVRVDQLMEGLKSAQRRTQIFAADLAQSRADQPTEEYKDTASLSRREKAGRTLDTLEKELGDTIDKNVRVERFRFDRTSMPVGVEAGWNGVLASTPEALAAASAASNDQTATPDPPGIAEQATNLSAVFDQLANQSGERAGHSTRLAVVLSDGRHNDVDAPPPQEVAAQLTDVPIYVVPIGNSVLQRDVLLHRVEAPATVAEKDSAVIDVIITGFDCEGQSSSAVLRHEGREVDRKPVEFTGSRSDYRARFMVPAKELGWQEYIVEVEPVEDEANTANNYQPVSFEVVRDRVRVLLADGVARWEYRYLNQLFRRDEHVEFDELLFHPRLQGTGKLAERPEFPKDVDGWAAYDVVILGDISPRQLSTESQQALAEFVRTRGGNLLLIAGQNSMPSGFAGQPLMELLPVERAGEILPQQGYTLRLTEEGRFHSALLIADSAEDSRREWRSVYERFPVFGLNDYSRPKSTARTLIEAVSETAGEIQAGDGREVEHAFLCWHRFGAGRVAYLAAPDTYRLRWRRGDRMHHRFWGQFLRWITAADSGAGADAVRMQTDRTRYMAGEPVEVTLWLKDPSGRPLSGEAVQVEARTFNNDVHSVELTPDADVAGRYFGTLSDLPAGAYQLSVKGKVAEELLAQSGEKNQAKATITVAAGDNIEMLNTHCNLALLEQIAQMTGGQVIPPTAIGEVLQLVSFTPEVSETIQRTPLWNRWSNLFIVLGCLFTEWIVRKAKGLV